MGAGTVFIICENFSQWFCNQCYCNSALLMIFLRKHRWQIMTKQSVHWLLNPLCGTAIAYSQLMIEAVHADMLAKKQIGLYKHSHNAIFVENIHRQSVLRNSKIMHCGILFNMPYYFYTRQRKNWQLCTHTWVFPLAGSGRFYRECSYTVPSVRWAHHPKLGLTERQR